MSNPDMFFCQPSTSNQETNWLEKEPLHPFDASDLSVFNDLITFPPSALNPSLNTNVNQISTSAAAPENVSEGEEAQKEQASTTNKTPKKFKKQFQTHRKTMRSLSF